MTRGAAARALGERRSDGEVQGAPGKAEHKGVPDRVGAAAVALLALQTELRALATTAEIGYFAANECRDLLRSQQVVFFEQRNSRSGLRAHSVSSLSIVDPSAPLIRWFEEIMGVLSEAGPPDKTRDFDALSFASQFDDVRRVYPLRHFVWLPWLGRDGSIVGGMLLARSVPWSEQDDKVARYLCGALSHAWLAAGGGRRVRRLSWVSRRVVAGSVAAGLLLLFVPVPMSALAPVEVAPREALIVTSGVEGVIRSVEVEPNAPIKSGQLLVSLSDTVLRNRAEIAEREVLVADTKLKKASQLAFVDARGRHDMAIARSELELKLAERDYARELLGRAEIRAERDGVAFFADKRDLVGRPVGVGEKLMEVADPARSEFRIDLPVADAIVLRDGARIKIFLDADPLNAIEARLERASYKSAMREGQQLAFRLVASVTEAGANVRLGARGTAQVFSDRVPLGFYLLRRPISALRQWIGL